MAERCNVMHSEYATEPENAVNDKPCHRIAPGGFLNLVGRLNYKQWSAIIEKGFGGILAVRTRLVPKRLARGLLEKYDLWDTSLKLPNGKVLIYEEDVHSNWRKRLNIERGGPPIRSMDDVILECGGHGPKFIIDFIIYAISTCIIGNANGTCHFRVLKYLHNANEIHNYNWCAYVIKCLNDVKGDQSKFFMGPLLFLMVSTFYHFINVHQTTICNISNETNFNIYNVLLCQLFYLDRVEFGADKVKRWFLIAVNWPTKKMRKRDRDEQLPGEYRRGRIIERIDY
ncbi:hypothetical protein Cgig2_022416 [Carnegiea gigantea]|uniref:Aminotransferase-like plant mobile domain-containing protein n=1 Tax=Carnegiea gigantea TaxID=171969 RepID=A0A9Q1JLT7_9CARY|nr:hypothetical protein Cgig2_022416 [Carnegiea gigantea]